MCKSSLKNFLIGSWLYILLNVDFLNFHPLKAYLSKHLSNKHLVCISISTKLDKKKDKKNHAKVLISLEFLIFMAFSYMQAIRCS